MTQVATDGALRRPQVAHAGRLWAAWLLVEQAVQLGQRRAWHRFQLYITGMDGLLRVADVPSGDKSEQAAGLMMTLARHLTTEFSTFRSMLAISFRPASPTNLERNVATRITAHETYVGTPLDNCLHKSGPHLGQTRLMEPQKALKARQKTTIFRIRLCLPFISGMPGGAVGAETVNPGINGQYVTYPRTTMRDLTTYKDPRTSGHTSADAMLKFKGSDRPPIKWLRADEDRVTAIVVDSSSY